MACLDIWADVGAAAEQLACRSIRILIVGSAALVAEIGSRIASCLVWELVHETNWDDVDVGIGAEMSKALLIWSLALQIDC